MKSMIWLKTIAVTVAFAMVVSAGCADDESPAEDETTIDDASALCFGVANPAEPGYHDAEGETELHVYLDAEQVPECTSEVSGECEATIDDDELVIEQDLTAVVDEDECPDIEQGVAVDCGVVELQEESTTVQVGGESYDHRVPTGDDAHASGPLGPEWSDCVGVGEDRTDDDPDDVCVEPVGDGDDAVLVSAIHEVGEASCVDDYTITCGVEEDDGEIVVSSSGSYRWVGGDNGGCTADIWDVRADCAEVAVSEGSYDIVFGDEELEIDVPLDDEHCSGE